VRREDPKIVAIAQRAKVAPALVQRVADCISEIYQGSGHDLWGEKTPSKAEYVCVMLDLVAQRESEDLTPDEYAAWNRLSDRARRQVALLVGP
jgi:hypothetical protein